MPRMLKRWIAGAIFFVLTLLVAPAGIAQIGATVNRGLQYSTIVGWDTPQPTPKLTGEAAKIPQLKAQLTGSTNAILQAELKMLEHKYPQAAPTPTAGLQYSTIVGWGTQDLRTAWIPGLGGLSSDERPSALHTDLYGGTGFGAGMDDSALNLITGKQAITESLQLGSIDTEANDPDTQLLRDVSSNIEAYKIVTGKYPQTLRDFASPYYDKTGKLSQNIPQNKDFRVIKNTVWYDGKSQKISDLAGKFTYQRSQDGKTFTLKLAVSGQQKFTLADLKAVQIKSHPWAEMLAGKSVKKSEIFSLVPADHFLVYFKQGSTVRELQNALNTLAGPTETLAYSQEITDIVVKVARRLGITNADAALPLVGEIAFVSQDLDFYPGTDYAVILNLLGGRGIAEIAFDNTKTPGVYTTAINGYLVFTTSQRMLDSVRNASEKKIPAMADAPDLAYTLSVLDPQRDGLAYLSEAFITKLVSPNYRILAAQRNATIRALETLQYIVFAYRDLKGKWPRSIQQIANEGYLNLAGILHPENYTVDAAGWVTHKQWGSMRRISSVSEIKLAEISKSEKLSYERFQESYQQFWREFFDPIGIAVSVTDQITLHTVILPLIDESAYNMLSGLFGGPPIKSDFVFTPDRAPAILAAAKLNDLTTMFRGETAYILRGAGLAEQYASQTKTILDRYGISEETFTAAACAESERGKTCRDALVAAYPKLNVNALFSDLETMEKPLLRKAVNAAIAEELDLDTEEDVLGYIGDEVMLGMGTVNTFGIEDLANLDYYLGIKLANPTAAKKFVQKLFQKAAEESDGSRIQMGPFSFSTKEPPKTTYRDIEYATLPTGFFTLSYLFLDDKFYLAASESAIKQIIDGAIDGKGRSPQQRYRGSVWRGIQAVGETNNLALHVDLPAYLAAFKEKMLSEDYGQETIGATIAGKIEHLNEALTLAKTLPGFDGTLSNVTGTYYRSLPQRWLNSQLEVADAKVIIVFQGSRNPIENLNDTTGQELLGKIFNSYKGTLLDSWMSIKNVSVGLKLSEDGLDSKVSFSNPTRTQPSDPPPLPPPPSPTPTPSPTVPAAATSVPPPAAPRPFPWILVGGLLAGIALIIVGGTIVGIVIWHKHEKVPENYLPPETPATGGSDENPPTPPQP